MEEERNCYTYILAYPNGIVFYVGEGTGDRIHDHEREARRGVRSAKCDIIRSIWEQGEEVLAKKMQEHLTKTEACIAEECLIEFFGPENLVNIGVRRYWKRKPVRVGLWLNGSLLAKIEECMRREGIEYSSSACQNYVREICDRALAEHIATSMETQMESALSRQGKGKSQLEVDRYARLLFKRAVQQENEEESKQDHEKGR